MSILVGITWIVELSHSKNCNFYASYLNKHRLKIKIFYMYFVYWSFSDLCGWCENEGNN